MENKRNSVFMKLIALTMSFIMIFSVVTVNGITAFAIEGTETETQASYIASVGENKYETLQEAVDAAEGETTVTLLADAAGNGIKVEAGKNIIFDFAGHTYTVDATLVGSEGTKTNGMQLKKGATVTLKNGTLAAGKEVRILVQNYCDLTVDNFNIDVTGSEFEGAYALSNNSGNILVTGESDITSKYIAFDLWYNLNGSYPEGLSVTFDENYTGTVTGTIEYGAFAASEGWFDKTALTIKNGTFNGDFTATSDFEIKEANITVTGGTFSDAKVADYCDKDYKLDENGNVIAKTYIAQLGEDKYETLQEAVDAAEGEATVTLLANAAGNGVKVEAGKNITFDFGGHTYTVDATLVGSEGTKTNGMQLKKGATVTLKNGTLEAGKEVRILVQNYCDLTVDNFNIDVTGSEYEGAYALSNNSGNILVTGESDITSKYIAFDLWYNLNGSYPEGLSVTFDENYTGTVTGTIEYGAFAESEGWLGKTALTIKNGTFNGDFTASSDFEIKEANITVTGGTFSDQKVADYCDKDYKLDENGNVIAKTYIAQLGEDKYETLQEAVDAAEGEATVTLLANAAGNGVKVEAGKNINFDFGGHTYTVDATLVGSEGTKTNGMQLKKGATVTLKNGTLEAGKEVRILVQNYCDLTVDNFNIDVTGSEYEGAYALSNNSGNILVTGESDIISKYIAFDLWYNLNGSYPEGLSVTFDENYTGTVTGTIEYGAFAESEGWLTKTALTIKNGTFNGDFTASSDFFFKDANIIISGGRFISEIPSEWCAETYSPAIFEDGSFGVCAHEFTEMIIDDKHFIAPPSCDKGNLYYYDCAKCATIGDVTFDDGNFTGHEFTSYMYNDDATCTEDGTMTSPCNKKGCNETHTVTAENTAFGHEWSEWTVTEKGTCIKEGKEERICQICEEKEEKAILAQHSFSKEWTIDEDATCLKGGSKSHHCEACDAKTDVTATAKKAHNYKTTITKATAKADGAVTKTCQVCGNKVSEKINRITVIEFVNKNQTYKGKALKPKLNIRDSAGKKLVRGTDYTVKFTNNNAVGQGKVTITFIGNYSGTSVLTFNINLAAVTGVKFTANTSSVALSWTAVKGAQSYKIYSYNAKSKKYVLAGTVKKTKFTFKKAGKSKLTAGTTYKIKIVAVSGSKVSPDKIVTVSTKPAKVSLSKLTAGKKTAAVNWKTVSGASGYEVTYSTSKSFTKKTTKTATVNKAKTKKTTLKKLKSGKKYYVKVRAFKTVNGKKIYGDWSSVKTVKVK